MWQLQNKSPGKVPAKEKNVKICQLRSTSLGKWVFAGLLFMLTMTFSLVEVNAGNYQYHPSDSVGNSSPNQPLEVQGSNVEKPTRPDNPDRTTPVPEPTTMLLMARTPDQAPSGQR